METNTYYYAGIDIGSTTVKLVLLNEAGEMVWGEYRRHCAHTQETLAEMMREARKNLGACRVKVRMTGSGAISLAEALRGRENYLFHRRSGRAHERRVRGRHGVFYRPDGGAAENRCARLERTGKALS